MGGNVGPGYNSKQLTASAANTLLALWNGANQALEDVTDGAVTIGSQVGSFFTMIHDDMTGDDTTGKMHQAVMGYVEKSHVADKIDEDYKKTTMGKWLEGNAYETFKRKGFAYEAVKTTGYIGAQIGTGVLFGGTPEAMAVAGALSGEGRGAQESFKEMKEAANGKEWRTEENYAKGTTYANATGAWEGLQWLTGAKIQKIHIPGASALKESGARVAADTVFNAADTPYRTTVKLASKGEKITAEKWLKEFENQGGWNQVGTDIVIGGAFSALGEVADYGRNKAVKNIIKTEGLSNREEKLLWDALDRKQQAGEKVDVSNLSRKDINNMLNEEKAYKAITEKIKTEGLSRKEGKLFREALDRKKQAGEQVDISSLRKKDIENMLNEERIKQGKKVKSKKTTTQSTTKKKAETEAKTGQQAKQAEVDKPTTRSTTKKKAEAEATTRQQAKQAEVNEPITRSTTKRKTEAEATTRQQARQAEINEPITRSTTKRKAKAEEPKEIDTVIKMAEEQEIDAFGGNKECFLVGDYALLREEMLSYRIDEIKKIMKITDELEKKGVHIAKTIDYKVIGQRVEKSLDMEDTYLDVYILQKRAEGSPFLDETTWNMNNNQYQIDYLTQIEAISKENQEFFETYIRDWLEIEKNGLSIDPSKAGNFMYEPGKGITFIDLGILEHKINTENQLLEQLVMLENDKTYIRCSQEIKQQANTYIDIIREKFRKAAIKQGIDEKLLSDEGIIKRLVKTKSDESTTRRTAKRKAEAKQVKVDEAKTETITRKAEGKVNAEQAKIEEIITKKFEDSEYFKKYTQKEREFLLSKAKEEYTKLAQDIGVSVEKVLEMENDTTLNSWCREQLIKNNMLETDIGGSQKMTREEKRESMDVIREQFREQEDVHIKSTAKISLIDRIAKMEDREDITFYGKDGYTQKERDQILES
ncbi:MAG: hypothetical protein IKF83_00715, partial [Clostridia bacterium]|nr:hypothetical protein [Clostridia bacterium]